MRLLLIIFLLFTANTNATSLCDDYLGEIENNIKILNLDKPTKHNIYSYGFEVYHLFGDKAYEFEGDEKHDWKETFKIRKEYQGYSPRKDGLLYIFRNFDNLNLHNFVSESINENQYLKLAKHMDDRWSFKGNKVLNSDDIYELNKNGKFKNIDEKDKIDFDLFLDKSELIISHINGKPISEYNDSELFKLFYFDNNPKETEFKFHIFRFGKEKNYYYGNFKIKISPIYGKKSHLSFDFDFQNFFELDTVSNKFSFDYMYGFSWTNFDLNELSKKYKELNKEDEKLSCIISLNEKIDKNFNFWYPDIEVVGRSEFIDPSELNFEISYSNDKGGTKFRVYYNGTYQKISNYNLKSFPFDKQEILIPLRINNLESADTYIIPSLLVDGASNGLYKYIDDNFLDNEFNLSSFTYLYDEELVATKKKAPIFVLKMELERKSSYYIYKVILPISLILLITSCVFFIPSKNLESRLTLSVVSFLALIAYIFVIDESIPKLSYMTYIDYFTISAFILAGLPNLWAIYAYNYFNKNNKEPNLNKYLPYVHFLFFCIIAFMILTISINRNSFNTANYLSFLIK